MTEPDVIVIGGGFAGLSAAAALAERAVRVLVLDARPQLGGRATAFRDRATGELVDNGQHVLFGCYRETFRLLHRIGAADRVRIQASLAIPFVDRFGRRSVLRCPPVPAPLHLVAAVLDWDALPWRDRLSALRLLKPIVAARRQLSREGRVTTGADETVSMWLARHGQRPRLREWLWDPLAIAALNQSPDEAAAAPFVRVLVEMLGRNGDDSAIALPTRPLHQMYAEPAREFILAHQGAVRTNALTRLECDGDSVTGVEIRGERMAATRVVAAVPWFALRSLFSGTAPPSLKGILASADAMEPKPIVTVNLWYDRPVMGDDTFIGLPGRAMQWVFDKRTAFGGEASHLSLVSSGADALVRDDDASLIRRASEEVRESIVRARDALLLRATVIREPRATFSLAPGQPPRPGTVTGVRGLYLAGDWIETGLPSTIESAVKSGHMAADRVLSDMRTGGLNLER